VASVKKRTGHIKVMAHAIIVDVIPKGGGAVDVTHVFWGETSAEAKANYQAHAAGCEFLTPAIAEDRVEEQGYDLGDDGDLEEFLEQLGERPDYDDPALPPSA
jgi:hypothetical protein